MNTPGKPAATYHSNAANPFAKALFEIGGTTVQQASSIPGGMVNDAMSAIFGGGSGTSASENQTENQPSNDFNKAFEQNSLLEQQREEMNLEKQRAVLHKEYQMTEVFNLREEKDKQVIKQLQEELQKLVKEVKQLDQSAQTAATADVVNPGTYHVSFFQQLLNFVVLMRKRVSEANTWMNMFNSKKAKQNSFWGKVSTNGTAYMMSQEHQVARNVG